MEDWSNLFSPIRLRSIDGDDVLKVNERFVWTRYVSPHTEAGFILSCRRRIGAIGCSPAARFWHRPTIVALNPHEGVEDIDRYKFSTG